MLGDAISFVTDLLSGLADIVMGALTLNPEQFSEGVSQVSSLFEGLWEDVCGFFADIGKSILDVFGSVPEKVVVTLSGIKDKAFEMVKTAYESIKDTQVYKTIKGTIEKTFNDAKETWKSITSGEAVKTLKTKLDSAWNSIKEKWDSIKSKAATLTLSFSVASKSIKTWINDNVIKKINNAFDKTSLLSWINVPYLAHGGIVNGATTAVIGEAGAEAVIPLERNTGGIQKIAQRLSQFMGNDANEEVSDMLMTIITILEELDLTTVVQLDGETIARVISKANERRARRTGYSY